MRYPNKALGFVGIKEIITPLVEFEEGVVPRNLTIILMLLSKFSWVLRIEQAHVDVFHDPDFFLIQK